MQGTRNGVEVGKINISFAAFPNPASEQIRFSITPFDGTSANLQIYTAQGQMMELRKLGESEQDVVLPVNHYPPGIYLALMSVDGKTQEALRFVVVH